MNARVPAMWAGLSTSSGMIRGDQCENRRTRDFGDQWTATAHSAKIMRNRRPSIGSGGAMRLNFSKQHTDWKRNSRCPICNKFSLYVRDYVDGKEVTAWRFSAIEDASAIEECPKCNGRWFVYDRQMVVEVVEDNRELEVAYSDEFVLDNLNGRSTLHRKKTIGQQWTQVLDLSTEETSAHEASLTLGNDVMSLSAMAQNAVKTAYKISEEQTRTYSEELEFDVPAGVRRRVTLTYKRVWQHGRLLLRREDEGSLEFPFKVLVSMELDVRQDDSLDQR